MLRCGKSCFIPTLAFGNLRCSDVLVLTFNRINLTLLIQNSLWHHIDVNISGDTTTFYIFHVHSVHFILLKLRVTFCKKSLFFMYHVYWPVKGINMYLYFTRVCCMVVLFPHMHSWLLFGFFSATFQSFLMLTMSTLSWSNIFEIQVLKIFLKIQKLYFKKYMLGK